MNPLILVQLFTAIPKLVQAVQEIMNSTAGHTIVSAVEELINHNTPGKSNSAALSPSSIPTASLDFQAPNN